MGGDIQFLLRPLEVEVAEPDRDTFSSTPRKPLHALPASVAVADSACDCYATNGSDAAYFTHHTFYDFRSLAAFQGTPELVADARDTANAAATSAYFVSSSFTSFWQPQNWNSSSSSSSSAAGAEDVLRINSLNNIYIAPNTDADNASATWLTLRTARQQSFQSAAELVSQRSTFHFLSMRMLARTVGSPGGCMGMFTYRDGSGESDSSGSTSGSTGGSTGGSDIQEADLEVLTKYPRGHVQCTNQPSLDGSGQLIAAATQNATLPDGLGWDDWVVYRLDWTPRRSTWYANGQQLASIAFQTPRAPTSIHINAWSDGGKWTGRMVPGTEAHLQIQWWEVLYNATDASHDAGAAASSSSSSSRKWEESCSAVCSIDADGPPGQAILLSINGTDVGGGGSSKSGGAEGPRPGGLLWHVAGFVLLMHIMVMIFLLG
ncbi:MAG: hypothetical protein STHCBS139747_000674 [Sporothrix thermara]